MKKIILASGPATITSTKHRTKDIQTGQGWRFGSLVARYAVGACLASNIIFLIFACVLTHVTDGIGVLYQGDCEHIRILDTGVHIIINGLATAIVSASNYTMQCLVAPNRTEIDTAHAKGAWLDIGIPSVQNLRHIAWRRAALWFVLGISTIPVHLMWNSVIFSTIQDNEYVVVGASANTLQDSQFNCTAAPRNTSRVFTDADGFPYYSSLEYVANYSDIACDMYKHAHAATAMNNPLVMLEAKECLEQYNPDVQSKWSNVIVVFDHVSFNDSCVLEPLPSDAAPFFAFTTKGPFWEQRSQTCLGEDGLSQSPAFSNRSLILGPATSGDDDSNPQYPINYCLAMHGPEKCHLEFSLFILLIVTVCNLIKLVAITYSVKVINGEHFITLGDAIASFLKVPDMTTVGHCLNTKNFFQKAYPRPQLEGYSIVSSAYHTQHTETGEQIQLFWFRAPSVRRWCFTLAL